MTHREPPDATRLGRLAGWLLGACLAGGLAGGLAGCGQDAASSGPPAPAAKPPNILLVVWDTVRADHLGLYGHDQDTTPALDLWARDALVFENALSTASSTTPSHASLFTGLLPSEHGANSAHPSLDTSFDTLAELLSAQGYQTYLWAANPHLCKEQHFTQGFDVSEHPWSPAYRERATRIVTEKQRRGAADEGAAPPPQSGLSPWAIKAAGELAEEGVTQYLDQRDPDRPWFVFVNYMEAHRPFIPTEEDRRLFMSEEQLDRSYAVDRSWLPMWSYTFGMREYPEQDLEVMSLTYDAALHELDELFRHLLETLGERGLLDDTIVVLTADHGEMLGEHHMMDHQFSLYSPVTHVPLVIKDEARFGVGRTAEPVMVMDLFPTLLGIAGAPVQPSSMAVDLLARARDRVRLSEYPAAFTGPLDLVQEEYPGFDRAPWTDRLRALYADPYKLIEHEDGSCELYDLVADPLEEVDLARTERGTSLALTRQLFDLARTLDTAKLSGADEPELSAEQTGMLEALGYIEGSKAESRPAGAATVSSWSVSDRND